MTFGTNRDTSKGYRTGPKLERTPPPAPQRDQRPPDPAPQTRSDIPLRPQREPLTQDNSGGSSRFSVGKWGYIALAFLILLASTAILLPRVLDWVNKDPGPQPIHIEDTFMDIDSDGDMDFVQQADVLLNCGGQLCSPTPVPALQAPQAGELGGDPNDFTDPDTGGGGPSTPDD